MNETLRKVKVWDGWLRLFHWLIVGLVIAQYVTAELSLMEWHFRFGYLVLALLVFRLGWGLMGSETARFARTLGTLMDSGVALTEGLAIATRTFRNQVMTAAITGVANQLKQGQGLARPLEATGLLPPIAVTFLRTGEETERLGDMLGRLADTLDRDIQKSTQRLMALLVPVITIVLGLVVAVIVGAILTAMLSLNELAA
jgi:general secretion pathway protein F